MKAAHKQTNKILISLVKNNYKKINNTQRNILLVEDDPIIQYSVRNTIIALGYNVRVAGNALTAMQLYNTSIHLVLVDLNLPDQPGFCVANYIRTQESYSGRHIPIIGHTSIIDKEIKRLCRLAGMDDVIKKLKTREELEMLLDRWLPTMQQVI